VSQISKRKTLIRQVTGKNTDVDRFKKEAEILTTKFWKTRRLLFRHTTCFQEVENIKFPAIKKNGILEHFGKTKPHFERYILENA
jgi:hypothetical protein